MRRIVNAILTHRRLAAKYGVLNKIWLKFERTFWPEEVSFLGFIPLEEEKNVRFEKFQHLMHA